MSDPIFDASGLGKSFGDVQALRQRLPLAHGAVDHRAPRPQRRRQNDAAAPRRRPAAAHRRHGAHLRGPDADPRNTSRWRRSAWSRRRRRCSGMDDRPAADGAISRRSIPGGTLPGRRTCSSCWNWGGASPIKELVHRQRPEARHRRGALPSPDAGAARRAGQQPRSDRARPLPEVPARGRPGGRRHDRRLEPRAARRSKRRRLDRVPQPGAGWSPTRRWTI